MSMMAESIRYLESLYIRAIQGGYGGQIVLVRDKKKRDRVFELSEIRECARYIIEEGHLDLFIKFNLLDADAVIARNPHGIGGANEVVTVVAIGFDVDAEKSESYASQVEVLDALDRMPLAPSLVVQSDGANGGFHVYWLLRPINVDGGEIKQRLRRAFKGWHKLLRDEVPGEVDPTTDLCRLLRPVGSKRKSGEYVRMWSSDHPELCYSLEQVESHLPEPMLEEPRQAAAPQSGAFNVADFLRSAGLDFETVNETNGTAYKFICCPFGEHESGDDGPGHSQVFKYPDGKLTFHCFHATHASKKWPDLRELLQPGYQAERDRKEAEFQQRQAKKSNEWTPGNHAAPSTKLEKPKVEPGSKEVGNARGFFDQVAINIREKVRQEIYETGFDLPLARGQVIMLGGAPGAGKSTFLNQCVFEGLRNHSELKAVIASVELPPEVIVERQITRLAGVSATKIRNRTIEFGENMLEAYETLGDVCPRLDFLTGFPDMASVVEACEVFGANVVLLDYVQRFRPHRRFRGELRQQMAEVMDIVRHQLCGRLGCAVLLASATNRGRNGDYKHDPHLGVFRESSELEFGCEDCYYVHELESKEESSYTEFVHLKSRFGQLQNIYADFCKWRATFQPPVHVNEEFVEWGE